MPAAEKAPPKTGGRTPTVVKLLVLATFVVILNETIMMNATPRLMADWHISEQAAQWVSTVFMLTMAAVVPTTGWFLQKVTTRRAYAIAMGVFLAGTVVSAAAPWFAVLLAGRVVQAAGTAVMLPLLMTTLMTVVPPRDRGRVMGNVTMSIAVAPALGPALSGLILQFGSWRLLFVVVLPIAGLITFFGLRRLENVGEQEHGSIDWISVAVAALGFGGLVYGLSQFGEGRPETGGVVAAAGAATIAIFVWRQRSLQRDGEPLMDLRTLKQRTFALSLVVMVISFMAMIGTMFMLPIYLQSMRGLSPLTTGLLVMPGGLLMGLLGPTVGRLFDRFGGRPLIVPGAIGMVATLTAFAFLSLETPFWVVLVMHLALMVSLSLMFTPVFTLGLGALPQHLYSHGSSMLGTLQQVAAAFGTALVVTIKAVESARLEAEGVSGNLAQLGGLQIAFGVGAGLAVIVVIVALVLPGRPESDPHGEGPAESTDGAAGDESGAAEGSNELRDPDELQRVC